MNIWSDQQGSMDLGVLSLACLYAIDVCEVNVLYKVVCAFVLLVYARCSLGERQRWRVWLGNQNTRGFGRQDKTSHLMNCPWCPQGVPSSFPSQPFPPFAAGATYKFCIRRCEQVSYLLLFSFIFAFPQPRLNSLSSALSSHLRRSLDALHCIVTRKR